MLPAVYRVLLRTMTDEGVVRSFGSAASPWMRPKMRPTAVGAVQSRRESIVVRGICRYADSSMLSKPITWTSSGTRRPEARKTDRTPIASWSFSAITPSKGIPESTSFCAARAPAPIVQSLPVRPTSRGSRTAPRRRLSSITPRRRSCAFPSTLSSKAPSSKGSLAPTTARDLEPWSKR